VPVYSVHVCPQTATVDDCRMTWLTAVMAENYSTTATPALVLVLEIADNIHINTQTHNRLTAFLQDNLGRAVPEGQTILDFV